MSLKINIIQLFRPVYFGDGVKILLQFSSVNCNQATSELNYKLKSTNLILKMVL